jgi:hypothetical protein
MPSTDAAVAATRESWIPRGAVPRVVPPQMCGLLAEEVVWPVCMDGLAGARPGVFASSGSSNRKRREAGAG